MIQINTMNPLSIAPMMDRTDRHFRYFFRRLSRRVLLYTEMLTPEALVHGDREHLLGFHPDEHPISLQIGSDDPDLTYRAVQIGDEWRYDEFNLNVGCPSDRVQYRNFGACLMADPGRVRAVGQAMCGATTKPSTIKCRIGIDGRESYEELREFVDTVAEGGPTRFTIHARIAILEGLSPKDNRTVPPLRYEDVYRLKRERPDLEIEINGGFTTLPAFKDALRHVDAVMVGRAAYDTPAIFGAADAELYGEEPRRVTRRMVVEQMIPYVEAHLAQGRHPKEVLRHMLGLFSYCPGARRYRRSLGESMPDPADGIRALASCPDYLPREVLDEELSARVSASISA